MKNILFVASEAVPFIKTGGLADVVGSLPKCFDKEYFDVRVMIPKYLCIPEKWRNEMTYIDHFYMDYLGQSRYVGIMQYIYDGITFYFIDNESYFGGRSRTVTGCMTWRSFPSSVTRHCPRFRSLASSRMWCTAMTGRPA